MQGWQGAWPGPTQASCAPALAPLQLARGCRARCALWHPAWQRVLTSHYPSPCSLFRNLEEVEKLSELGVLFLLFEMGLELSIDRLRVGAAPLVIGHFRACAAGAGALLVAVLPAQEHFWSTCLHALPGLRCQGAGRCSSPPPPHTPRHLHMLPLRRRPWRALPLAWARCRC